MDSGQWWGDATLYQVYLRSFADGDGDGLGDLDGVRAHLDHLRWLGVDGMWLGPVYPSPMVDGGYDVADTMGVDARFGGLEAFDRLVAAAHESSLRIIGDLVPNHLSDQHPWFQAALVGGPGHPARARFHFHGGDRRPNDWPSHFGGPAWTQVANAPEAGKSVAGEWFLHLYAPEQPDLNWGQPEVAELWESTLRFWLDRGVDGFRIDSAPMLAKPHVTVSCDDPLLSQGRVTTTPWHRLGDQDAVHAVYRRWRALVDEYGPDRVLVAELDLADATRRARYLAPDELHAALDFSLVGSHASPVPVPLDAAWLAQICERALALAVAGMTMSWTLENHDRPRAATRWGSPDRAAGLAAFVAGLGGVFWLYQGQELALPHVDVHVDDPQVRRGLPSRDGARLPMPWNRGRHAGFSAMAPWAPVPDEWVDFSVEAQRADRDSWLWWYRDLVAARQVLRRAPLPALDATRVDDAWLTYRRELLDGSVLHVLINCAAEARALDEAVTGLRADDVWLRSDRCPNAAPVSPGACVWLRATGA